MEGVSGAAGIADLASAAAHTPGLLVKGLAKVPALAKLGKG